MRSPCAIFFFEGHLGVSPTVLNLCTVLDRDGYDVTVYGTRNPYPTPRVMGGHSRALYLRRLADVPGGRLLERGLRRLRLGSSISLVELILYVGQCRLAGRPGGTARRSRGGLSVGIDTMGVIAAWLRRRVSGTPYAYLSLEIGPSPGFAAIAGVVRLLERRAYREASVVMVQDEGRLEALTAYLRYRHPHVTFLPNAPLITPPDSESRPPENFLRLRCGISESSFAHIVLHAGMIDDAVYSQELARSFAGVDEGCALVFHERLKRDPADPYLVRLREMNDVNLFLSLDPVPIEDLDRVYASATIGVVFYRAIDANWAEMASASGKLGYYLKHGKPVLASGSASLAQFVEERGIGVLVPDPTSTSEIRDALGRILADYVGYAANARACYAAEFDFETMAREALAALRAVASPESESI